MLTLRNYCADRIKSLFNFESSIKWITFSRFIFQKNGNCNILVVYHEIKVSETTIIFLLHFSRQRGSQAFLFVIANSRTISSSVIVHVWASCYWFPGIMTKLHFIKHYKLIVGLSLIGT